MASSAEHDYRSVAIESLSEIECEVVGFIDDRKGVLRQFDAAGVDLWHINSLEVVLIPVHRHEGIDDVALPLSDAVVAVDDADEVVIHAK